MPRSNASFLGQLLGTSQKITASALDSSVSASLGGGGVATYTAIGDLPSSGLTSGDMAFVDSSDRLYIWTGAGWYNIAVVNQTPAIQSILDSDGLSSPFVLSNEGATTTITMIAADPDGFPVSYIAVADSDFNAMATLSQVSNVFTITPTAIENSTGTITFKASDGINLASEISTFTLVFSIPDPDFNSVSFLSNFNGADNGVNNTFIDGSTSAHAITANGNVTQGSFGPFARPDGEWAVDFGLNVDPRLTYASSADFTFGTDDFTIEFFVFFYSLTDYQTPVSAGYNNIGGLAIQTGNGTGKFGFYSGGAVKVSETTDDAVSNKWYHIAFSRQSGTLRVFRNGVQTGTASASTDLNRVGDISIGSSTSGYGIDGLLSNVRLVKGTSLYNSNFTTPTSPLTAVTNTTLLTLQSNRFVDNSGSAHTVTPSDNPAVTPSSPFVPTEVYDPAVNGASAYFDGTGDYLSVPTPFGAQNIWTIETWYNPISYAGSGGKHGRIWTEGTELSASIALVTFSDGTIRLFYNDIERLTSSSAILLNSWTHIAVVSDGSSLKLYVNGVLNDTHASNLPTENRDFLVASMSSSTGASNSYVSGLRATSTAVYTGAFTIPTAPPTAITGTKLLLNMNNGKAIDGTAKNNLTLRGNVKLSSTQSKFGGTSLFFDGTFAGDYVTAPDNSYYAMGTGNFTIECWIYPTGAAAYSMIFEQGSTVSDISFGLKPTTLQPYLYAGGFVINGSSNAQLNVWQHIALVRNSGTITIYLNGISIGSTSTVYNYTSQKFMIGATTALTNFIKGYIDDFRISKTARYTSNFTPPSEPFPNLG